MIKQTLTALSLCVVASACATAQETAAETPDVPGWLEKDFAEFVGSFAGQWDSDRHVFFASDAGLDPSTIAPQQHIDIRRLSSESDESAAVQFRAVRTVDGEAPIELTHTFDIDAKGQGIRHTMAAPGREALDCTIHWKREAAQFRGTASGAECAAMFPRPAEGGPLNVTLVKSENDFWITAQRGDAQSQARLRRARPFECWTAILRGAEHGDSGEGMRDWDFRRGVTLHDQGGEAELMTDEETPRRIRLKLRNVDWPYGTNRPSLTLYVLEGESDRAVSYAWNEGNAERIGINLRWLQASCTYAPDAAAD